MNYFIDTEFLEGVQEPKWLILKGRLGNWIIGKPKPTIDLISIGIVSEDGREYYAISKDFNLKEAWNRYDLKPMSSKGGIGDSRHKKVYWIRENVLKPIFVELFILDLGMNYEAIKENNALPVIANKMTYSWLKKLIKKHGKTNKEIAEEIIDFTLKYEYDANEKGDVHIKDNIFVPFKPKFYAYYADYDWVAFCWLFGNMMDLPNGFPKYCRDLKQDYDFFNANFIERKKQNAVGNIHESINELKDFKDYPKQENEHNALADARWNKELYKFLNNFK